MGTETRFGERESPGHVVTVAQGSDVLVPVSCVLDVTVFLLANKT